MTETEEKAETAIVSALRWTAAFAFSLAVFFVAKKLLRWLPATEPVAIGRVTIDHASKSRDYLTAALFYVLVPLLTTFLAAAFDRLFTKVRTKAQVSSRVPLALACSVPLLLAPFFYLTTRKEGWALVLPLALSSAIAFGTIEYARRRWLRLALSSSAAPANLLIALEGLSWVLFRYLVTGTRIAHIPTLFLEVIFVAFFVLLFWATAVFVARLASLLRGDPIDAALTRVALAGMPFLLLPISGLFLWPAGIQVVVALLLCIATYAAISRRERSTSPRFLRRAAFISTSTLLFCVAFASNARLSDWVDLFHRGESLGPASDFLRGKIPYRDVFVLHGLFEDGFLDALLMRIFGRSAGVADVRWTVMTGLMLPAVFFLGWKLLRSYRGAALVVLLAVVTGVDNHRALFEVLTLALLIGALEERNRTWMWAAGSGVAASLALFMSFDIGIYSFAGAVATIAAIALSGGAESRRLARRSMLPFAAGAVAGALPVSLYLLSAGAFGSFFETSFVIIPKIIDATWSLPFPDLDSVFRTNLSLTSLGAFVLGQPVRFVINFAVISIALAVVVARWRRDRAIDVPFAATALFALVTQRTALGRADFPHQYFSAFLVAPLIVALATAAVRQARAHDGPSRSLLLLLAVTAIPTLFVAFWVPDLVELRLSKVVSYRPRVSQSGYSDPVAQIVGERIQAVREAVGRLVPPGEPIFDFSNQPAFYFFADRPNPTRFYQIPILSPLKLELEAIASLERAKPAIVIRRSPGGFDNFDDVPNDLRAPSLDAYLRDCYSYLRTVRGVELWRRTRAAAPRTAAQYAALFSIPKRATGFSKSFLIFPAVGNIRGVGSLWKSDLLAYNNLEEPIRIRLRYTTAASAVERAINLPPRRLTTFTDVAQTLFSSPNTLGSMKVEYENDRVPLLKLRTYDAMRSDGGYLQDPISTLMAASANAVGNELTIVGAIGSGVNRVNLGVINSGEEPAAFRIFVTDQTGNEIGSALETGLTEERSYVMVDVETQLKTKLDGSQIIHVRMQRGSAIGYVSVVGPFNQLLQAVPFAGR